MNIILKISTIIFVLIYTSFLFGQEHYKIRGKNNSDSDNLVWPAKWFNDKKSAFSFSFDDGIKSQYENAVPILNQYNFKGTFYVIPNYLDGSWRYGTWPMFISMALEGHEIGSHSMNHYHMQDLEVGDTTQPGTILYELYQSKKLIEQKIDTPKCITFAYPYAEHNSLIDSLTSLFYESARANGDMVNSYSLSEEQLYKLSSFEVRFSEPRTTRDDDLDELDSLKNWINSSITEEGWGILLAHEVVPFDSIDGSLWYPYSIQWFTQLCEWVNNKSDNDEIWVGTVADVTIYLKERNNFHYNVLQYDSSQIQLEVDDSLNDEIYNHSLTIFVKVPDEWNYAALLVQNEVRDTVYVSTTDSGQVVMANVFPGVNQISLYKITPTTGIDDDSPLVNKFELFPNYPNPFNPSTTIRYTIAGEHHVKLIIFDLLGNEIATLVNEEENGGSYSVNFVATNLASGVYIYSLRVDEHIINRKMTLIK